MSLFLCLKWTVYRTQWLRFRGSKLSLSHGRCPNSSAELQLCLEKKKLPNWQGMPYKWHSSKWFHKRTPIAQPSPQTDRKMRPESHHWEETHQPDFPKNPKQSPNPNLSASLNRGLKISWSQLKWGDKNMSQSKVIPAAAWNVLSLHPSRVSLLQVADTPKCILPTIWVVKVRAWVPTAPLNQVQHPALSNQFNKYVMVKSTKRRVI